MTESVKLAIKGGRYEDAERELTAVITDESTESNYFLLATVKSNLLLGGRSFEEVKYCYEKCYELTENSKHTEQKIIAFNKVIYNQLDELIDNLKQQKKVQWAAVAIGTLITHTSAKHIENSKSVFGNITGIVGASYGVGMSLGSMSALGEIDDVVKYAENLQRLIIAYLKSSIKTEQKLISDFLESTKEKKNPNPLTDPSSPLNDIKNSSYILDIVAVAVISWVIVVFILSSIIGRMNEESEQIVILVSLLPTYFIVKSDPFKEWRKKKYIKRYVSQKNLRNDPKADPEIIKLMDKWGL
tara:strand:- start:50 stop:949 length:900 start_codon:yes stop_codon:yes gene_type:complete